MAREFFCAYHSYRAWMETLTDAEKGRLFDALLAYSETGEQPSLSGKEAALFPAMKWQIDRDTEAYTERCTKNRGNGSKGGRPKKPNGFLENPTEPKKPKEKEKAKENDKATPPYGGDKAATPPNARARRFTPPTLEEVTAYVQERGSAVDPQGFIDFYASKGWLVGKTPMKDWKAACRNAEGWERWHDKRGTTAPKKGYDPGQYDASTSRVKENAEWLDKFLSEQEGTE